MAARLNRHHQDMVREKIRASQLINRLEDHIFEDKEMTSTQVNAALGLLKKCVPDLKSIEADIGGEIETVIKVVRFADTE